MLLKKNLQTPDETLSLHALRVLWNLTHNIGIIQSITMTRLSLDCILTKLSSNNENIQIRAIGLIMNLCQASDDNSIALAKKGVVDMLVTNLLSGKKVDNKQVQLCAIGAISNITKAAYSFVDVSKLHLVFDPFLDSRDTEIQDEATRFYCNFISQGHNTWSTYQPTKSSKKI